jgi:hypothetical protein
MISTDSLTAEFSGESFPEHREFVGDDSLAVYLKDVELEISNSNIDRSIEIADCQGSDSPNPLHLAMIQDYLLRTHFIIYVISSRTGLRQADIRFLSMIKKMGILGNILFVVNIDLSEHESLEELRTLLDKIREELILIKPEPDIYTFSSLFNLFSVLSGSLNKRDSLRLAHWTADKDLVDYSNSETHRFESLLNNKLTQERFGLLLKNHLERMGVLVSGVRHWTWINKELLEKDVNGSSAIIKKIEHHQEQMEQIKSLIRSTLSGALEKIMKEMKTDIDRFFGVHSDGVLEQTLAFVREYTISVEKYRGKLTASGFSKTLYYVFQEFKQAIDTFMAETINPRIARFLKDIEDRIQSNLESVAVPYQTMASDAVADLKAVISNPKMEIKSPARAMQRLTDMDAIKRVAGLTLPSSTAALPYSTRVRTEAVMRLGFYSAMKLFKRVLKKPSKSKREEQMLALADVIRSIKRET